MMFADLTKKSTMEQKLSKIVTIMTDPEGVFRLQPELVFFPSDLANYNQGPSVLQHECQRRVVAALLELGFVATHSEPSHFPAQIIQNTAAF